MSENVSWQAGVEPWNLRRSVAAGDKKVDYGNLYESNSCLTPKTPKLPVTLRNPDVEGQ